MRRGFWFAAGAGAGAWAVLRARRVAESVTPDGLRDRIGAAWIGAGILRDEMAQGMVDAESELRERYGASSPGRELPAPDPAPDPDHARDHARDHAPDHAPDQQRGPA